MKIQCFAPLIAAVIVVPISFELFDRRPPFSIISGITVPAEVKRGGQFRIDWQVNNNAPECNGKIYRYMKDSKGRIWPTRPFEGSFGYLPREATDDETVTLAGTLRDMPPDIALGPLYIFVKAQFKCNLMHELWPLSVDYPPVKTTVIE